MVLDVCGVLWHSTFISSIISTSIFSFGPLYYFFLHVIFIHTHTHVYIPWNTLSLSFFSHSLFSIQKHGLFFHSTHTKQKQTIPKHILYQYIFQHMHMTLLLPVQILKDSGTTGRKSYIQSHTHTFTSYISTTTTTTHCLHVLHLFDSLNAKKEGPHQGIQNRAVLICFIVSITHTHSTHTLTSRQHHIPSSLKMESLYNLPVS